MVVPAEFGRDFPIRQLFRIVLLSVGWMTSSKKRRVGFLAVLIDCSICSGLYRIPGRRVHDFAYAQMDGENEFLM